MLKVQEIRELIKLVDQSSIDEFVYENEGSKIQMKKNGGVTQTLVQPVVQPTVTPAPAAIQTTPSPAAAPVNEVETKQEAPKKEEVSVADSANLHKITSPMVGTFYSAPSPDAEDYVKPGSKVTKDTIVCIVEAMKLFNEIEAEVNGEIVEVLVKNGQLVEYGQPLFLVKPE
ncbi:acetyl-CoA carboxylase biotin carboxyl carrier protein [Neobacillus thermocopriae]|uniref:Biotin carboxyl carrier protein of acetyl-CoA carboxylase n=1 Tax=Neobacillus thermocopriae TaxID=1215031 RepID=A0A6B3TP37_9BACI|nr:acetyl-CoA carboxylase biotin carboxyl carrier protein [Neobacillus thermocopriae]MED3624426.1 acetyl-CoA carboxylase biotin carboxyl carrier protein [Neobacillus thermocopriae]MED3714817.1 acetyl-CoA carboxylase biotin carboxyl carrier protein [Neobacillus thermocopriae]NEX78745.1 acetyl-CoA carboxylase biotin carboxyl carrier protein [Neobacillus thermocopriae]